MGKRGPKPKSTVVRILEGNPSRREINPIEPIISELPEKSPAVLSDPVADAEWDRVTGIMPPGVYTAADSASLAQYALAWSMLIESQGEISKHGLIIEEDVCNKDGIVVTTKKIINPAAKTWKAAQETLIKMTDRLGLSPGVRSRLQVPPRDASPSAQSKFAGLITGR